MSDYVRHVLKSQLVQFAAVWSGAKVADLRRADRPYNVGDDACLREYDHEANTFTGREVVATITYITSQQNQCALSREAIAPEYCILSLKILARYDPSRVKSENEIFMEGDQWTPEQQAAFNRLRKTTGDY